MELLRQVAEQDFIAYLKVKNPDISETEINQELNFWYQARPGAEFGDGDGRVGDPSRFGRSA